ncbi:type II toxin-antitoxin system prevent-host-death family antitoxin [Planktothricoides raciborskii]|uniref:Antitoxin n=1 Tax=Planktothricoides raciborskii GIHE-MW2 TaxID=2792601 RepID=A0AAU8JC50_9CYAN
MKYLNLQENNPELTAIIDEIAANQSEVIITRNGLPVARIVPYPISETPKKNYPLRGMPIKISDDFDEPMPELWDALGE